MDEYGFYDGMDQQWDQGWDQGQTPESYDWTSGYDSQGGFGDMGFGGDWGNFDFGGDFSANQQIAAPQFTQQQAAPQQQMELPPAPDVPQMQAPQTAQPSQIWNEPASAANGLGGPGSREEESWLSKLGKGALGMGMGVGTSVLGNLAQGLMAPKQSNNSPLTQGGGQGAVPTALPGTQYTPATQPQYTPQPLEPEPGTKASPLISGRPTSVKGSAGLKERNPSYGGFSMY